MRFTVLGSGTIVPHPQRGCAGYLLRGDGVAAVLDTGSGTKDRLARQGVRLGEITHFLYSHGHIDHFSDLLVLLFYRVYAPPEDRRPGLTIAGPPGFTAFFHGVARAAWPDLIDANADVEWRDLAPADPPLDAGWFSARAFPVSHGHQSAVAWRLEGRAADGRPWSLAYSGDASPCPGLNEAARGVDLLVCECAFPTSRAVPTHMTPGSVRSLAEDARPGLLVLTHLYPEVLAEGLPGPAFDGYSGRVVVAHDGLAIPLPVPPRIQEEG
ncbi:ribonuclease Z [Myxococcota bacterium]|nr:ribonuclease Z [Myxococcota bacterium]